MCDYCEDCDVKSCCFMNKSGENEGIVIQNSYVLSWVLFLWQNPHVESYSMHDIKEQLHLDRERLVALAVLLGCDYLPKGVPSVGRDLAMKFMSSLPVMDSVLERYAQIMFNCLDVYCSNCSSAIL